MNPPRSRLYRAGRLLAGGLLAVGLLVGSILAIGLPAVGLLFFADDPAKALTIGTTVHGEITSTDRINYNDGSRSKLYRFDGKAGEALSFQVSGVLRARLELYADGRLQVQTDGERDDTTATKLTYLVESDQTYVLAVSGMDRQASGPFQLTSERLERYGGGTLTPDMAVSDVLDSTEREIPLIIETAGLYQIDLRSNAFHTVLRLSGNGVAQANSDGSDGEPSRIVVELQPGRYTLKARGYSDSSRGLYILSVAAWTPPNGGEVLNGGTLPLNRKVNGLAQNPEGNHYTLKINSRQLVTIDLESDTFNPYLELSGNGVFEKNDDRDAVSLNARIRRILEPGTYQITAKNAPMSFLIDLVNPFQLSARGREVPEGAGRGAALVLDREVSANLLEGIPNRHAFNVSQYGGYVIRMVSGDIDSVLRLYRNGEQIAINDNESDLPFTTDARIVAELTPGEYVVEASAYGSEGGNYRIAAWQL